MVKYTLPDEQIGIFSDIHFGINRDNVKRLEIASEFIDRLVVDLKSKKIKSVFFLGDWFDHRNSINVNTLNSSYINLLKLSKHFNVYLILGNHDLYFKYSVDVNSIKQFEEIKNVHVIEEAAEISFKNGRNALLCPWHFKVEDCNKHYDYLFGHFEFSGATLYGSTFKGGSYTTTDLNNISPLVFSGHFHIHKEYKTDNGNVVSVGSPLQLDWGDYSNQKGYYILDTNTADYTFIPNKKSPIYFKYFWTRLKKGTQKITKNKVNGNFIKLIIDDRYQYEEIMATMDKINQHEPLKAEPDFVFSINENLLDKVTFDKTKLKMTKIQYIIKFIEKMEEHEGVDKKDLTDLAKQYYCKYEQT